MFTCGFARIQAYAFVLRGKLAAGGLLFSEYASCYLPFDVTKAEKIADMTRNKNQSLVCSPWRHYQNMNLLLNYKLRTSKSLY